MKNKSGLMWLAIIVVLAVVVVVFHSRIHFDLHEFLRQLRVVDFRHIGVATVLIYLGIVLRSWRWSIFMRSTKKIGPLSLVGSQFIGFTAVGLFGRLADLARPYIISKRTQTPLAMQVAIYTMERIFDLGAAAAIFSSALLFIPKDMPHHELFLRTGKLGAIVIVAFIVFLVVIRSSGVALAGWARIVFGRLSPGLGGSLEEKILSFREGMNAIRSLGEFAAIAAMSLTMWGMIAFAYFETTHAFVQTPELGQASFAKVMLLMAASIGGSALQLPIIGWFTQIGVLAAAMAGFLGSPIEPATACGALLLIVTFLSVIPAGLLFARIENVSLSGVAKASEAAAVEELTNE